MKSRYEKFDIYFMKQPSSAILREVAYNTICDLLVVFCNQLTTHTNPLMHQLVYEPDQAMQNMLNRFIQEYVFFEEEDGK